MPQSERALAERDASFFARLARLGESWRLFEAFSDRCVYLDIETTGLSPVFNTVTVVGLYDGSRYRLFIEGQNLDELPSALKAYSMAVTFNGSQFDMRFLRCAFPGIDLPAIHVDLRWLCRRLGFGGGLKEVEAAFGLQRPREVQSLTGFDATVLWSRYLRGDGAALERLILYNTQDVVNLKLIMERSYDRMVVKTTGVSRTRASSRRLPRALPVVSNPSPSTAKRAIPQATLVTGLIEKAGRLGRGTRVVGIDLTGSEGRASGWALLDGAFATTGLVKTDAELIAKTLAAKPDLVSIDSPLSLPGGKKSPRECQRAALPIYRACELALKRMGISVFWCLLPTMKSLTMRGMLLARALRAAGTAVIESYPGAAQDLMQIPRKGTSLEELKWGLHRTGIGGTFLTEKTSHDEIDAITSALVGLFYAADEHISLGNATEDYLIVPRSAQIDYHSLADILQQTGLDPLSRFDVEQLSSDGFGHGLAVYSAAQ
jgi:uncharacterized protein YprB with RNaseH-like and TPR domain/predicted nuclease with RNAse H fold